jgi:hypothetical protein
MKSKKKVNLSMISDMQIERGLVWKALRRAEAVVCIGEREDGKRRVLKGRKLMDVCRHAKISTKLTLSRACPFGGAGDNCIHSARNLREKPETHFWRGFGQAITAMRKSQAAPKKATVAKLTA